MKWFYVLLVLTILQFITACGGFPSFVPKVTSTVIQSTREHTSSPARPVVNTITSTAPNGSEVTTTAVSIEASPTLKLTPTSAIVNSGLRIVPENAAYLAQVGNIHYSEHALVLGIDWSPDGELLAVSTGNDIYIYNSPDINQIAKLHVGSFTNALAFSPDGALLAAGSRDSHLRVWDVSAILNFKDEVSPYLKHIAHKKGVNCIAFSTNGTTLATGGNDGFARLWDPISGAHTGSLIGGTFAVPAIAFYPKDDILAVVNGDVVRLRDVQSESIVGTFLGENPLFRISYHPEGGQLVAGDTENQVLVWNHGEAFRSGSENYPEPVVLDGDSGNVGTDQGLIWQLVFSPDGQLLITTGSNGIIHIWDFEGLYLLTSLVGHNAAVTSVAFHPNGQLLASGSLDGSVRIWGVGSNH